MSRNYEERASEAEGWRQVKDYCQRFGRDHLQQYLVPLPGVDVSYSNRPRPPFPDEPKNMENQTEIHTRYGNLCQPNTTPKELSFENEKLSDDLPSAKTHSNVEESPESAKALKKLEWDSLADIGYGCDERNVDKPLSTIERIALKQHYETEFTMCMNSPTAQSTPNSTLSQSESTSRQPSVRILKDNTNFKHKENLNTSKPTQLKLSIEINEGMSSLNVIKQGSSKSKNKLIHTSSYNKNSDKSKTLQASSSTPAESSDKATKSDFIQYPVKNVQILEGKKIFFDIATQSAENQNIVSQDIPEIKTIEIINDEFLFDDTSILHDSASAKCDNDFTTADSFEYIPANEPVRDNLSATPSIIDNDTHTSARKNISNITSPNLTDSHRSNEKNIEMSLSPLSINSTKDMIDKIINLKCFDSNLDKKAIIKRVIKTLFEMNYSEDVSYSTLMEELFNKKYSPKPVSSADLQNDSFQPKPMSTYDDKATETSDRPSLKEIGVNTDIDDVVSTCNNLLKTISKSSSSESIKSKSDNACSNSAKKKYDNSTLLDKSITILDDRATETSEKSEIDNQTIYKKLPKTISMRSSKESNKTESDNNRTNSKNDYSVLLDNSEETKIQLNNINEEISKLLMLKMKLETRKHSKTKTVGCNTECKQNISTTSTVNSSKSSNTISSASAKMPTKETSDFLVPLLNLKSSSEESLINPNSKTNKHKNCKTSTDSKLRNYLNKKSSQSTKSTGCKCDLKMEEIVCNYCNINIESNSTSGTSKSDLITMLNELEKVSEKFSKYKKCKLMNAFLKDYGDHVKKRTESKKKYPESQHNKSKRSIDAIQPINPSESTSKESSSCASIKSSNGKTTIRNRNIELSNAVTEESSYGPLKSHNVKLNSKSKYSDDSSINSKSSKSKNAHNFPTSSISLQIPSCSNAQNSNYDKTLFKKVYQAIKKCEIHLKNLEYAEKTNQGTEKRSTEILKTTTPADTLSHNEKTRDKVDEYATLSVDLDQLSHLDSQTKNNSEEKRCRCNFEKTKIQYIKQSPSSAQSSKKKFQMKKYPKSIAYDLILKPSESVLNESSITRKKEPLEQVIVKIPLDKGMKKHSKNEYEALCNSENSVSNPKKKSEEIGYSTDEQLKEFSSLIDDRLDVEECKAPQKDKNKSRLLTIEEYLLKNKPTFVRNLRERQEFLKEFNRMRNMQERERRIALETGLIDISNHKNISESKLRALINLSDHRSSTLTKNTLFNPREIVKRTARQYRKLPEIICKKELIKKQAKRRTNRLMADIFVKNLRRKTLRGIVNISHNSNIISL